MTIVKERKTKETDISLSFNFSDSKNIDINTGLPFFDHMLTAMAFHGNFGLQIKARGDLEIDQHHLIEDLGLVFGECLFEYFNENKPLKRFGQAIIPMDDALSEVIIDISMRPFLVFNVNWPQEECPTFSFYLIEEFLRALSNKAQINLHINTKYGRNSHHIAESIFKALGICIKLSYSKNKSSNKIISTKGLL